jgi:hypothetical protein
LTITLNYGGSLVVEQINFQLWPEHENLMIAVTLNLPGNVFTLNLGCFWQQNQAR